MKTLSLLLSVTVFSFSVNAQQKITDDVPGKVLAAFSSKYPGAEVRNWKTGENTYSAKFKTGNKSHCAFYSPGGAWLKTETKVQWTWNLPGEVKNALKSGGYAAWYIDNMKRVETPQQNIYVVHVDNANVLPGADYLNFKDDYNLYYNANGKLVKKELLP